MISKLKDRGIGSQVLYIPVHLQPWYRKSFGYGVGKCPNAENAYPKLLSLPLYSSMSDSDVNRVISGFLETAG